MDAKSKANVPATVAPAPSTSMQKYLDRAVKVLGQFKASTEDTNSELVRLLEDVKHLDEPKVLAISRTISYMSRFNQLVRDNVENIDVGNRYLEISQGFDSIREDSKTLINQLQDGRISVTEKMQNLWMRLRRGTPSKRFEEIAATYKSVAHDTKDQLDREQKIMDAYIDFRFALKEAEVLSTELLAQQNIPLEDARKALAEAQAKAAAPAPAEGDAPKVKDPARAKLELARDEALDKFQKEDRNYQLLKDITENLSVGYDVGDTLITKLKQTHDVKDRVYRRSVTFFTTNEHVLPHHPRHRLHLAARPPRGHPGAGGDDQRREQGARRRRRTRPRAGKGRDQGRLRLDDQARVGREARPRDLRLPDRVAEHDRPAPQGERGELQRDPQGRRGWQEEVPGDRREVRHRRVAREGVVTPGARFRNSSRDSYPSPVYWT